MAFKSLIQSQWLIVSTLAIIALVVNIIYLLSPIGSIADADESVFGLMALAIGSFKEFPAFCWEAHYAGAVVSYFAAVLFKLFGVGSLQLKCGMLPFALGTPVFGYLVFRKMFGRLPSFLGAMLLIFCPYFILMYRMAAVGGYGETLLGTVLIVYLSWQLMDHPKRPLFQSVMLGLVSGFFFYTLFLVAPVIAVFVPFALWSINEGRTKCIAGWCVGGLVGVLPMIIHNITSAGGTLVRTASRSTLLERADIHASILTIVSKTVTNKLLYLKQWFLNTPYLFGSFMMPAESPPIVIKLAGLLLIGVLVLFLLQGYRAARSADRWRGQQRGIWQFGLFFIALIGFIWIPNLDRTRHLMPLLIIMPIAILSLIYGLGFLKRFRAVFLVAIPMLGAINVWGWIAPMQKVNFDPAPVVAAMKEKKIGHFYGSYWTSYPIMFVSEVSIIGSPLLLPFNEPPGDRRPDYTKAVMGSANPAFFFDALEHGLQRRFMAFLLANGISCDSLKASTGTIMYNLSSSVDVENVKHWVTDFTVRPH